MVMAMFRLSGLGATLLTGSALVIGLTGCDSGGTTAAPTSSDTGTGTGANTGTGTGTKANTGTGTGTGTGTKANTGTGTGTGTGSTVSCSATPPTATGTLSVASGYVTAGTLKGYGFTWKGDKSNATTCITPTCNTTGCLPAFGTSALCGAGVVTADTTYNSVCGIGMNLNQTSDGSAPATVAMGATITITATVGTGLEYARIQISGDSGDYCVAAGSWSSGSPIPVGSFNKTCWDTTAAGAAALTAGTTVKAVHLLFPSDATVDHPFSACLTGVSM